MKLGKIKKNPTSQLADFFPTRPTGNNFLLKDGLNGFRLPDPRAGASQIVSAQRSNIPDQHLIDKDIVVFWCEILPVHSGRWLLRPIVTKRFTTTPIVFLINLLLV